MKKNIVKRVTYLEGFELELQQSLVKRILQINLVDIAKEKTTNDQFIEVFSEKIFDAVTEKMKKINYFKDDEILYQFVFDLCMILDLESNIMGFTDNPKKLLKYD